MKKYTICICDDDSKVRTKLRNYLLRYSFVNDVEIETIELDSAEKLLDFQVPYDILFLDIRFGSKSIGIDTAEKLRLKGNTSIIIITSVLKSMLFDGYRAEPFRFILKPFTEEQILEVLNACISKLNRTVSYLKIISDSQTEFIRTDKIIYIYSKQRKRQIVCTNNEILSTWQSLNELMINLPEGKFTYAHKSYIVNLDMIDSVKNDSIQLINHISIPLGTHFKAAFMETLLKNWEN